jgi:hypothetical protein
LGQARFHLYNLHPGRVARHSGWGTVHARNVCSRAVLQRRDRGMNSRTTYVTNLSSYQNSLRKISEGNLYFQFRSANPNRAANPHNFLTKTFSPTSHIPGLSFRAERGICFLIESARIEMRCHPERSEGSQQPTPSRSVRCYSYLSAVISERPQTSHDRGSN